jgi:ABC-2 type transport system permease protein
MIRLVLALCDRLAWLLRRAGVDYELFRAILEVKLTLDTRRRSATLAYQATRAQKNTFAFTLVMYVIMGGLVAPFAALRGSMLAGLTVVYSFVLTMIGLALLADYSVVLLDATDQRVLAPRPVTARTILFARLAHVLIYLCLLAFSLSAGSLIAGTWMWHGVFPLMFGVALLAGVGLIVGIVSAVYLLGMRYINEQRLRDIVLYAQIAMTIIVASGYQLMPRIVGAYPLHEIALADRSWLYGYPPLWLAGVVDLGLGHVDRPHLILAGLALVVPLVAVLAVARLASAYRPSLLQEDGPMAAKPRRAGHGLAGRLSRLVARDPVQQSAFELVWHLGGRDRNYKLRVFPQIGFVFVFGFVFVVASSHEGIRQTLAALPNTNKHLFLLYFGCLLLPNALMPLRFTSQPEAAWVYFSLPVARPGDILLGALQAVLVRIVLPTFLVLSAVTLAIWPPRVIVDVLLALSAGLLVCVAQALLIGRALPFSQATTAMESSGRSARALLLALIPASIGGLHFLLVESPRAVLCATPIVLLISAVLARAYRRTDWRTLARSADY